MGERRIEGRRRFVLVCLASSWPVSETQFRQIAQPLTMRSLPEALVKTYGQEQNLRPQTVRSSGRLFC